MSIAAATTEIAISATLAGGVSTALAALLLICERYLTKSGPCRIDLNSGKRQLDVSGGVSLLSTLNENNVFVPSACGGRGTCAYCKVKVLEGGGPIGPTELPLLTEQEVLDNVRISCQCRVRNDLKIEISEDLLLARRFSGVVEHLKDLTADIKELRIKLSEPGSLEFVPGQYIQLETPAYKGSPNPVSRAYSISSIPSDRAAIELVIRLVPGGICTTWVFEHLQEGDPVSFTGPFGDFRLSDSDRAMVWVAGGSGMAPFWSMIRHMKERGMDRRCRYFFGAVKQEDLLYLDQLRRMEEELPWFTFVPALSRPAPDEDWAGESGLITEVVDKHVESSDQFEGYLCGSPGLIDAAIEVLKSKGVDEDSIFYDKFA